MIEARNKYGQPINRGDLVKAIMPGCKETTIQGKVEKIGQVSSLIKDGKTGTTYNVLNNEILEVSSS